MTRAERKQHLDAAVRLLPTDSLQSLLEFSLVVKSYDDELAAAYARIAELEGKPALLVPPLPLRLVKP